jgi:hypothetical protein
LSKKRRKKKGRHGLIVSDRHGHPLVNFNPINQKYKTSQEGIQPSFPYPSTKSQPFNFQFIWSQMLLHQYKHMHVFKTFSHIDIILE